MQTDLENYLLVITGKGIKFAQEKTCDGIRVLTSGLAGTQIAYFNFDGSSVNDAAAAPIENQHRLIKGYRDLSQAEIDLMNEAKEHAERTRDLLNRIDSLIDAQARDPEKPHSVVTSPARWLAEGRTDLQKGFMCVIRSIAQPTTF